MPDKQRLKKQDGVYKEMTQENANTQQNTQTANRLKRRFTFEKVEVSTNDILDSLSDKEIKAALKHFLNKIAGVVWHQENERKVVVNYEQMQDVFGLPYTSSGDFAGMWITNGEYYYNSRLESFTGVVVDKDFRVLLYTTILNEQGDEIGNNYYLISQLKASTFLATCEVYDDNQRKYVDHWEDVLALSETCAQKRFIESNRSRSFYGLELTKKG